MTNLFLCSHFSKVGELIREEIEGKKVAFIPTASINEKYTGYVGSARKLFKKLGAKLTEIEISKEKFADVETVFKDVDIIYFTGGNSFFLIDQLRKTGVDKLLKGQIENGKLFIGESAGAIVCAPTISYIKRMDEIPENYSQDNYLGLSLIDFYVLPHYLTAPFEKITTQILEEFSNIEICPINNSQAIVIKDDFKKIIEEIKNEKI
ncbi:Type 1 glutamine amidotransferase-like domain-containing protein [Fusobacterium varium]|uniref:Type 1 glutamine amidotransferase-like domain-containing protein n=1 Tax=Fusobacterium varium TaxID=856 RepID=UPI0030D15BE0